jgi:hypothetical protein
MADPKTKSATAAPPKHATVNIKVTFKSTGGPVAGATAGADQGTGAIRELDKSDGLGRIRNVKFEPGRVKIFLRFKNHRGEGLPKGDAEDITVIFDDVLAVGPLNIDVALIQIASQITVTVLEAGTTTPVAGARINTGAFSGVTDQKGQIVTQGLLPGALHTIQATRTGFGDPAGAAEGPVSGAVDLRGLTAVTNGALTIQMKPVFGKVKSSNIQVEGLAFFDWFKANFQPPAVPRNHPTITDKKGNAQLNFPILQSKAAFAKHFDDLAKWFAPEITIEEFISIFMIMANETGGTFKPLAEIGSISHMFYLNKPSNRLAGTQLKDLGKLTKDEDVAAWNATTDFQAGNNSRFPDPAKSGLADADLKECDFFKFRGRGFVQLTFHDLYLKFLESILLAAGFPGCDAMTNDELDAAVLTREDVFYPMLRNYLNVNRKSWALTNDQQWRQWGLTVAGQNNKTYGDIFQSRCEQVFARMIAAARAGKLILA